QYPLKARRPVIVRRKLHEMRIAIPSRQLNETQPIAMRIEAHRFGIDRDHRPEGEAFGNVVAMQLMAHAAYASPSGARKGQRSTAPSARRMGRILARQPSRCNCDRPLLPPECMPARHLEAALQLSVPGIRSGGRSALCGARHSETAANRAARTKISTVSFEANPIRLASR